MFSVFFSLSLSLSLPRTVRNSKLPLNLRFLSSLFSVFILASARHSLHKATTRKDLDTFTIQEYLLFRDHLLYVPEGPCRTRVLRECHDDPLAGHFGVAKTLELITRGYWWPQPWKLVKEYIKSCEVCARSKAIHHRPYGLLQPLPCPRRPWASISMDLITDLSLVNSYDSVLVVVDRFTKMTHFTPCSMLRYKLNIGRIG